MRYRNYFCLLVSCILPGYLFPDIPAQARQLPTPFPGTDLLFKNPPMQMPGIRSNIQLHFLPVMSIPMLPRKCQTTRSAVPVYRCGVSLLYIKQLYTLPSVSRCQPPKLKSEFSIDWWIYYFPVSLTGKRASIRCTSMHLSLTLFVLRILTDDPDASFSFDNLALLADRFHRRSYLHFGILLS